MKIFRIAIFYMIFIIPVLIFAQDKTTVEAKSTDISDNLDLEAVASIFGESKDLEDFEKRLNDPDLQISNLDLNEDGMVDYLRVVSDSDKDTRVVAIQAVLDEDVFQDVATIDVQKDTKTNSTKVQVVGDVYMYGSNYIIEPVYVHPPVIFTWFWGPLFRPWFSPWYWGYYPPFFRPWHPFPPYTYRSNVHVHINVNHTYRHTNVRHNPPPRRMTNNISRNDYARRNPNQSFSSRNQGVTNRRDLPSNRKSQVGRTAGNKTRVTNGRKVNGNWSSPNTRTSTTRNNANRTSTTRQATNRATNNNTRQSTTRPTTRQSTTNQTTRQNTTRPSNNRQTTTRPTTTRPTTTRPTMRTSTMRGASSMNRGRVPRRGGK